MNYSLGAVCFLLTIFWTWWFVGCWRSIQRRTSSMTRRRVIVFSGSDFLGLGTHFMWASWRIRRKTSNRDSFSWCTSIWQGRSLSTTLNGSIWLWYHTWIWRGLMKLSKRTAPEIDIWDNIRILPLRFPFFNSLNSKYEMNCSKILPARTPYGWISPFIVNSLKLIGFNLS